MDNDIKTSDKTLHILEKYGENIKIMEREQLKDKGKKYLNNLD